MSDRTTLALTGALALALLGLLLAPRTLQPEVQPEVPAWQEVAPGWQEVAPEPAPFPDPCELDSVICPDEPEWDHAWDEAASDTGWPEVNITR